MTFTEQRNALLAKAQTATAAGRHDEAAETIAAADALLLRAADENMYGGTTMPKGKKNARVRAAQDAQRSEAAPKPERTDDGLCTFAIRIPVAMRDLIHAAAGPGKASEFARTVLVAAAEKALAKK